MAKLIKVGQRKRPRVRDSHIIPRFYLNMFADAQKQVWVYRPGIPTHLMSTKGQCTEMDYFEYNVRNDQSNNKYEIFFARIEDATAKIYPRLMSGNTLTGDEIAKWSVFVATLFLRTKKIRNQMTPSIVKALESHFLHPGQIAEMQHQLFKDGHLCSREDLTRVLVETWQEMSASPAFFQLAHIEQSSLKLAVEIAQKAWHIVRPAPGSFFVTSDCPIITLKLTGNGQAFTGYGFNQADVAVVFPLSPDALFIASPQSLSWAGVMDEVSTRTLNLGIIQYAEQRVFANVNSSDVQTLVNSEINKVIYGINAYVASPEAHKQLVSAS